MTDKTLHFIVCFGATLIVSSITCFLGETSALFCGSLFSLGLGLGKEFGDSKSSGNHWDWMDILFDVLGIVSSGVLMMVLWTML